MDRIKNGETFIKAGMFSVEEDLVATGNHDTAEMFDNDDVGTFNADNKTQLDNYNGDKSLLQEDCTKGSRSQLVTLGDGGRVVSSLWASDMTLTPGQTNHAYLTKVEIEQKGYDVFILSDMSNAQFQNFIFGDTDDTVESESRKEGIKQNFNDSWKGENGDLKLIQDAAADYLATLSPQDKSKLKADVEDLLSVTARDKTEETYNLEEIVCLLAGKPHGSREETHAGYVAVLNGNTEGADWLSLHFDYLREALRLVKTDATDPYGTQYTFPTDLDFDGLFDATDGGWLAKLFVEKKIEAPAPIKVEITGLDEKLNFDGLLDSLNAQLNSADFKNGIGETYAVNTNVVSNTFKGKVTKLVTLIAQYPGVLTIDILGTSDDTVSSKAKKEGREKEVFKYFAESRRDNGIKAVIAEMITQKLLPQETNVDNVIATIQSGHDYVTETVTIKGKTKPGLPTIGGTNSNDPRINYLRIAEDGEPSNDSQIPMRFTGIYVTKSEDKIAADKRTISEMIPLLQTYLSEKMRRMLKLLLLKFKR